MRSKAWVIFSMFFNSIVWGLFVLYIQYGPLPPSLIPVSQDDKNIWIGGIIFVWIIFMAFIAFIDFLKNEPKNDTEESKTG